MHLIVRKELSRLLNERKIISFKEEKKVLLSPGKTGFFDFYAETTDKKLGFEVLSRPSKKKLLMKLAYASHVNEFIFVLPEGSFQFHKRPLKKIFFKEFKPKEFPSELDSNKIKVWFVRVNENKILEKQAFNRVYCVKAIKSN